MAKSGKSKKTGNDSTPVAPKDIKGDVTTENELSPKDAAAPRSSRKRAGDFNDFEKDEAVPGSDANVDTGASPTQPKKKSKTTSAAGKKAKQPKDDAKSVPTEKTQPGGDRVEAEPAEEPTTQRKTGRKTAGKSKATNNEIPIVAIEKDTGTENTAPSEGKKKKPSKADRPSKEKKEKPSKTDGHPVVTEKTHPGGDMVETEPAEASNAPEKTGKKPVQKSKVAKEAQEPTALEKDDATEEAEHLKDKEAPTKKGKMNATEKAAQKGKSKPDSDKAKEHSKAEEVPSQAQAVHKVTAPKKTKEPTTTEPKSKPQKSDKIADADPEAGATKGKVKASKPEKTPKPKDNKDEEAKTDASKGKAKATMSGKAAKSNDADKDESIPAPEEDIAVPPDQAMDEAPFKNLLTRERAKIPSVKASANAAAEASKASGKAAKALITKEPKSDPKDTKITDTETPAEASKVQAPKGKKRKEGSGGADAKVDSASSGKKQKKTRQSALEAATSAVGDLVNSGMEAAAQGVSAVKDLASGLGNNSLAEDITAVAGDAAEEKSKKAKAKKADTKKAVKADKGKGKEKSIEEDDTVNASDVEESEEDEDYEEGDQTMALIKGFESQDEDDGPSMGEGFKEGQTVPDLPAKKEVEKQLKAVKEGSDEPGVVYVGRIPHGFYETQMRAYFGQFGHISRLRLSRNRTTGNSKHYAFVEFASSAVAKIVAETMDNYLMFGHILKCKVVPPGDVHENLWKGANKRFKKVPWSKMEGKKLERKVGREEWGKRVESERKRRVKKKDALKSIGYEFEPPRLKGPEDVPVREGGEKAIEGATTTEEKTIVTTDGGDGTIVISEEVKTTKVKKSGDGKRKAAAAEEKAGEDGGPLAEVVKKAKKAKKSVA